jgi:putative inorganic carbon (hco3(-)) transporter
MLSLNKYWSNTFPRIFLIILALSTAFLAGFSYFLISIEYIPLLVAGAFFVSIILVIFLNNPGLALCSALLVIFLPDGLLPASIQSNLNRGLTIVAFAFWLYSVLRGSHRIVLTGAAIFMLGFLMWIVLTLFWAARFDVSIESIQKYILRFLLFLFLFPNLIRSEKELSYVMKTLAISGWLLASISIFRVVTKGYTAGTRLDVLGENENALGIGLLISLIGVIWLALRDQTRFKTINNVLSYIYLIIVIFIAAMSGSRGSAISLVAALFLLTLWRSTRPWGLSGLLIIILGLFVAPIAFATTIERFLVTRGDTMLGGREALWLAAWRLIQHHPWTGVGIGNGPISIIPFVRFLRSVGARESSSIHNPILAIWVETGVPGLLLYVSVLASSVWTFIGNFLATRIKLIQPLKYYYPIVGAVFIGYMLSWIKGGGMEFDQTYFLMLALLLIPVSLNARSSDLEVPDSKAQEL